MKKKSLLMLLLALFLSSCQSQAKEQVVVFNIGEYMNTDLVEQFEKDTGIDVIFELFNSQEEMFVKLSQGSNNYDVIVPTDYMVEKLIKNDMLEKIDYKNVPNAELIMPEYRNLPFDPKGEYSVPYFESTFGIIYNTKMVDEPITKWADLWDQKYKGEIIMYDLPRLSIGAALQYLGYSLNSTDPKEIEEATEALIKQKPLVYAYLKDEARDVVVQGDAAMCVMYNGDATLMRTQNPDLRYVIPEEKGNRQIDCFAIPKGAKNKKNAEIFINYFTAKENSAENAEWMEGFTSPVAGVRELLPEYIANSYESYPDRSLLPEQEVFEDIGQFQEVYNDAWVKVMASY